MATDNDGLDPAWRRRQDAGRSAFARAGRQNEGEESERTGNRLGHLLDDDGLAEDGSTENVADSSVRRLPE